MGRRQEVGGAVKDSPRVNDQTGRMHLTRDYALGLSVHVAACKNRAVEMSRDHHAVPFDLSLDFCILAQDNGLLRNDVSLDVAVDAKRTRKRQSAFERHTLINESCPLFTAAIFR